MIESQETGFGKDDRQKYAGMKPPFLCADGGGRLAGYANPSFFVALASLRLILLRRLKQ
jgi:hypothetical protein